MDREDAAELFGMGEGCPEHGDEYISACTMCGAEFCARCARRSRLCPDCAAGCDAARSEDGEDFSDVPDLDRLLRQEDERPGPG